MIKGGVEVKLVLENYVIPIVASYENNDYEYSVTLV